MKHIEDLATAIFTVNTKPVIKNQLPPNSDHLRSHSENVKRRNKKRIQKQSRIKNLL